MSLLAEKAGLPNVIHPPRSQADELTAFRKDMLKFARIQLRDDSLAEDAVQETFSAALNGLTDFENRAKLKTWVFGILKNKIKDAIREQIRSRRAEVAVDEISEDTYDELFNEKGCWQEDTRPTDWSNPESSFSSQQFWEIFEICLTRLPESTARIFIMRELSGLETGEICKELHISASNCWVMLHRARMGLRLCLEDKWFNHGKRKNEL